MSAARLLTAVLISLAFAPAAQAKHAAAPVLPRPTSLRPFLLTPNQAPAHAYPRTPSFAWTPVRGAERYEFELSKSPTFGEGTILWSSATLKTPAAAVPVALPWATGTPYAFYAHVRAISGSRASDWSDAYGFDVRWTSLPDTMAAAPGLVRWSTVDGATAYDVWFVDARKVIRTRTNVADEREYYSFHQSWASVVHWRVRAVRNVYGAIPNGLPTVSYGPWTRQFTSFNPPIGGGVMTALSAISEAQSPTGNPVSHVLTPGFSFTGTTDALGTPYELYRVYVFSDRDCVNVVFRGAIVGGPAYAPRMTGPLKLPHKRSDLGVARLSYLGDGGEGQNFMADTAAVTPTESDPAPTPPDSSGSGTGGTGSGNSSGGGSTDGSGSSSGSDSSSTTPNEPVDPSTQVPPDNGTLPQTPKGTGAPVDLWDSGWPNGRFYWTVVPVQIVFKVEDPDAFDYWDVELPRDACAEGRVGVFGKVNSPVVAASNAPYAAGLSPTGRFLAAATEKPVFYGAPLVAWQPAVGADEYEIQWSPTKYPWNPIDPTTGKKNTKVTYATSTMLSLKPGTWYYRVRGIDFSLPGTARAMTWSQPATLVVAKPKFVVKR